MSEKATNTSNNMSKAAQMYKSMKPIAIKPSHKGLFTAKANKAGMSVQGEASKVLSAPKGQYSPAARKQANFAKNASKWH